MSVLVAVRYLDVVHLSTREILGLGFSVFGSADFMSGDVSFHVRLVCARRYLAEEWVTFVDADVDCMMCIAKS